MSEELEVSGSDVSSGESSSPSESTSSEKGSNDNSQLTSGSENKPKEQYVPYDRFKELIEQKNEFQKRLEEQEKSLKDFRDRQEASQKPKEFDPKKVLERLKGIDPEFAQYNEYLMKQLDQAREFQSSLNRQQYLNNAGQIASRLQSDLKVDPVLHQSYMSQIPDGIPLDQIEAKYKGLHDSMSKYMEKRERSALSTYTEAKKSDSKIPTPAKGPAPKTSPAKFEYSKDPEEAKAQMVKRIMSAKRAAGDI